MKKSPKPLLLANIGQLLTLSGKTSGPRRGAQMQELGTINDAAVLCVAGKIVSVGKTRDALRDPWVKKNRKSIVEIDCKNSVVLPGFVDSHTHPAFMAPRLLDFEKRIGGATYEAIAESGGGIRSSVSDVRAAGRGALAQKVLDAFQQFSRHGTTTVEAKSGYGLTLDSELKSLRAIRDAAAHWPGTVVPTLLAAHVVPSEFSERADDYVNLICQRMIPEVARRGLARNVDVFCERGAFSEEQTLRVLGCATRKGLATRAHVSQLTRTSLQRLLSIGPLSLDHLDCTDDRDMSLIAKSGTVATLLPGSNYFLRSRQHPPARKLIDAGAAVALATDYNPGTSPTCNMQFIFSLACTQMQMSPAEAISAATINGAFAVGLQEHKGSIDAGKDADIAIIDVADYREVAYWFGSNLCQKVIAGGVLVAG